MKKIFAIAFAFAAVLASCTKDNQPVPVYNYEFGATLGTDIENIDGTRASITDNIVKFEVGDKLQVYYGTTTNSKRATATVSSVSQDGKSATMSVSLETELSQIDSIVVIHNPATETAHPFTWKSGKLVTLGGVKVGASNAKLLYGGSATAPHIPRKGDISKNTLCLFARWDRKEAGDVPSFNFIMHAGVMKLTLENNSGKEIRQINLYRNGATTGNVFQTNVYFTIRGGEYGTCPSSYTSYLVFGDGVTPIENGTYYFPLAPRGDITKPTLEFVDEDGNSVKFNNSTQISIVSQKITDIGTFTIPAAN